MWEDSIGEVSAKDNTVVSSVRIDDNMLVTTIWDAGCTRRSS